MNCISVFRVFWSLTLPLFSFGQVRPAATSSPSVPGDVLYYHLFRHIGFIENQASTLRNSAKDPSYIEHEYARRVGLTEADNQILLQVASDSGAR
jgi:hypothetical protein